VQKKIRFDEKNSRMMMIILGGEKIHTKKPSFLFLKATSFQFEAALHTLL